MASMSEKESLGVAWKKEGLSNGSPLDPKTLTFAAAVERQDH